MNRRDPVRAELLTARNGKVLFVATLAGSILGSACTGHVTTPPGFSNGTGGAGNGTPNQGGGGPGATGGIVGTGNGGIGGPGSATGGAQGTGAGGAAGDPYAIPASPPATVLVATPRVARLSRQQWSNTVRDLLKLTDIADIDSQVSGDALIGFDDEAEALFVTEQLRAQLFAAGEKLADRVVGDAAALARLVPSNAPTDAAGKTRAFVVQFGSRAFRRQLTDAEVSGHLALFNQGPTLYPALDPFKAGAALVIQAMLQSPYFLYRTELGTAAATATKIPLDDWEVASKLAFAVSNTMPDDALLAAASSGQLRDRTALIAQAKRLLDGATGTAGLRNFNLQIYRLGTYDGITRDPKVFPDFKANTPAAMRQEVLQFIDYVFAQGGGIKEFYTSRVGFVNALLAPIYGVTGTFSADPLVLAKTDLDPMRRSGLLTQAGFLSSYISGTEPDIIHRGVFIATRLLCRELPQPDPAAAIKGIPQTPDLTNRQRVEATTGKGTCGEVCHANLFNPLGYAFENYDAIGAYRTMDQGMAIDAADRYTLDGQSKSFSNGVELSHLLADAKETHACYLQNLLTYLHGRDLASAEKPMVDYYARLSRAGMATLRDLELSMVTSDAFLNRLP